MNGIGERAGNCSLEELVMILKTRNDRYPYQTGIHTEQLFPASQMLSSIISFGPQPNKAIVGRNAFAHEAGIHQDGMLKDRTTYEIIDPKSVGVPESRLVLGKHSGRHALKDRLETLGFTLAPEELDFVYGEVTALADNKKGLMDEEIAALARKAQQAMAPAPAPRARELLALALAAAAAAPMTAAVAVAVAVAAHPGRTSGVCYRIPSRSPRRDIT